MFAILGVLGVLGIGITIIITLGLTIVVSFGLWVITDTIREVIHNLWKTKVCTKEV